MKHIVAPTGNLLQKRINWTSSLKMKFSTVRLASWIVTVLIVDVVQTSTRPFRWEDLSVLDVSSCILDIILYFVPSESYDTFRCKQCNCRYARDNGMDFVYLCVWCFDEDRYVNWLIKNLKLSETVQICRYVTCRAFNYNAFSHIFCPYFSNPVHLPWWAITSLMG